MNNADIDIRKKEKELARDHWMCRVQKYTFGIDAPSFYMGYCPFFWMTWLAVLCFPIIWIARQLGAALDWVDRKLGIGVKYDDYVQAKAEKRAAEFEMPLPILWWMDQWSKSFKGKARDIDLYCMAIDFSEYQDFYHKTRRAPQFALAENWLSNNPRWRKTHLPNAIRERNRIKEYLEKRTTLSVNRSKCINQAACWTQSIIRPLVKVVIPAGLTAIVAAAILGLSWGIWAVIVNWSWQAFFGILCFLCFAFAFVMTFIIGLDWVEINGRVLPKWARTAFYWIGHIISSSLSFMSETIKMSYKAECPLILWGDTTSNIRKRKHE